MQSVNIMAPGWTRIALVDLRTNEELVVLTAEGITTAESVEVVLLPADEKSKARAIHDADWLSPEYSRMGVFDKATGEGIADMSNGDFISASGSLILKSRPVYD